MNNKDLRELCEAYGEIYEDGFENWVNSLLNEGYDLSDYTWDEMYEAYIEEQGRGSSTASQTNQSVSLAPIGNAAQRFGSSISQSFSAANRVPTSSGRSNTRPVRGGNVGTSVRPASGTTTPPVRGGNVGTSVRPAAGTTSGIVGGKTSPATSPTKPAIGMLGKTSFERRTPTSTELKAAQAARASGANPEQALQAAKSAGSMQKNFTRTDIKMPQYMKQDFSWGSNSKLVDDISNSYRSIYEDKKVDQDQDGDNDFADVRIARMIASGMSKEEAIAAVKNKSYNKKVEENFNLWIDELIDEGYDLSDYTWDEMYQIYEETDEERRRNERRARIAELTAQGRVMTSSKRTSQKARERKETQNAERLERLANAAIAATTGASRRSSQAMGSQPPEPKQQAPAANRKLKSTVKNDKLASRADELLRMLQNEDFKLWIAELLDEGYTLENWTDKELYDLYEEILEEKYGTAAGRKRVAKMARAGKDIGKKGPGFENMVSKLTPKYGKERATKIAAAQMYKTHA